jgi:hypothetical protein
MWLTKSSFNEEIYRNLIIIFMEIKIIYRNGKDFGEDMAPQHTFYLRPWNLCIKCRLINDIHFILNYSPKIQTLNLINLVELCIFVYNFVIICTFLLLLLLTTALFYYLFSFPCLLAYDRWQTFQYSKSKWWYVANNKTFLMTYTATR